MAGAHSSSRIVAGRYVRAIFEVAGGNDKSLSAFEAFFASLEAALAENKELAKAMSNPTTNRKSKAAAMDALAEKLGAKKEQRHFLMLLARNNRLESIPAVVAVFREKLAAHRKEVVLEITTARPLAASALHSIKSALEKETGKTTVLKTTEDAALLGGIVVRFGSTLLDYSVAGKLTRLEQSLKHHIANA